MSYKTELRKQYPHLFDFGPWYDHYVQPFGKCHPDFNTVVLGNDPRGVKVCMRKPQQPNTHQRDASPIDYCNSVNMYQYVPLKSNRVLDDTLQYNRIETPYDGVGVGTYGRFATKW
jgi:hypothetical protein